MCDNIIMDTASRQLVKVEASHVLGEYRHEISINRDKKFTILYGPNGVGKTKMLEIIDGVSRMDSLRLRRIPFHDATLFYSDGSSLEVRRVQNSELQSDNGVYSGAPLEFTLRRPSKIDVVWKPENEPLKKWATEATPYIEVAQDTWQDTRDGELITTAELLSRYGASDIMRSSESSSEQEEIRRFLKTVPSFLIETQRLKIDHYDNDISRRPGGIRSGWPSVRFAGKPESMIARQSQIIRSLLSEAQTNHSRITQAKDRTFPRRVLIGEGAENTPDAKLISERYDRQNALRTRLARVASVPLQDELPLPDRDLNDWELRLLQIYLDDTQDKLEPFTGVLNRIEMLEKFVNERLLNKVLEVNDADGLVVRRKSDNEIIDLDSLSSGEQHEIILLVDMLFNVPEGAIVLIDEPEISLHVAWQLDFIPMVAEIADLIDFVFIVATHSPQIINGEMDSAVRLGPSGARFE
jgi:hypothetical protein